jgi:hypothetical protein
MTFELHVSYKAPSKEWIFLGAGWGLEISGGHIYRSPLPIYFTYRELGSLANLSLEADIDVFDVTSSRGRRDGCPRHRCIWTKSHNVGKVQAGVNDHITVCAGSNSKFREHSIAANFWA